MVEEVLMVVDRAETELKMAIKTYCKYMIRLMVLDKGIHRSFGYNMGNGIMHGVYVVW